MDWLAQNWIWVVFFILFIGMHLFGHGGARRANGPHPVPLTRRDIYRSRG